MYQLPGYGIDKSPAGLSLQQHQKSPAPGNEQHVKAPQGINGQNTCIWF